MAVTINGGINVGSDGISINTPAIYIPPSPSPTPPPPSLTPTPSPTPTPTPGRIFGTPTLVFDFSSTSSYSNSGTSIADLSGNGNNGIFTQGTGNGTPRTVSGYSTNGYLTLPGSAVEFSVRLPNALKPTGTANFTYIVYMRPKGYSFNGVFTGIISNHNSVDGIVWGTSTAYTPPGGQYATRNNSDFNALAYQGGADLNVWSVYAIKFNGTSTTIYQYYNGVIYSQNVVGATSIVSSDSWGLFLGLRFNQWIFADFNYVAMYNTALSDLEILAIAGDLAVIIPT